MQNKAVAQLIKELDVQGIFESIGDAVGIQDTNFKILYQNNVSKNFIGNHVGEYCYKAYEKKDTICEGCPLDLAFKDNMIHKEERSGPTEQGVLYAEITASVLRNSTGKAIAGIEIVRDITDRKKAEEELRESEDRFRGLIDAEFDGIIIYEKDKIREANSSFVKMFGYNHVEVIDKSASEFVTLESYEKIIKNIQTGYEKLYEIKGVKKDGSTFEIEVIARNCRYHGRKARVVAMRDITERKKAEEALQKAHDELEVRVKERTLELQEKNIALKVLLKQREEDKKELEQNILSNVKSLIQPYIMKLKRSNSNLEDVAYLNLIESNLEDIVSPFSQKLSSKYMQFTGREIEIANLIREGKKDKEIMEIMNIAFDTVKGHRKNIRKKLDIHGKGTNLRNKLLSM